MANRLRGLATALLQGWVVFWIAALAAGVIALIVDHEKAFRSDDPFLLGLIVGIVPGVMATIFTGLRQWTGKQWAAHGICAAMLLAWCGLLFVGSLVPGEGSAVCGLAAAASAILGLLPWPLYALAYPKWLKFAVTTAGGVFLATWLAVAMHMMAS